MFCQWMFFIDAFTAKSEDGNDLHHLLGDSDYDSSPVSAKHSSVLKDSMVWTSMKKRVRVCLFGGAENDE